MGTDLSLKIKAEALGKTLENLSVDIENQLEQAVADLAQAAYAKIVAEGQTLDEHKRLDFLKSLDFTELGNNVYLISLEGSWANSIEDGYAAYDMKPGMLKSQKQVEVGSRAGLPWVRHNKKDGDRYAAVPMEKHPSKSTAGSLDAEIKQLTAYNKSGQSQKLTKTFKDASGKPMSGKVATARSTNPKLDRIVKYQHIHESGKVSSHYIVYRMVSDKSKAAAWWAKAWAGIHAFEEAEKFVDEQLEIIVKTLL